MTGSTWISLLRNYITHTALFVWEDIICIHLLLSLDIEIVQVFEFSDKTSARASYLIDKLAADELRIRFSIAITYSWLSGYSSASPQEG